jgi:hypothetical protein
VLLQQPGRQVPPQLERTFLALVERDQLVLVFGAEHQVEGGGAVTEEALAEFLTAGLGIGLGSVQDVSSGERLNGKRRWGYPIPRTRAQERDCTRPPRSTQVLKTQVHEAAVQEGQLPRHLPEPGADRPFDKEMAA